MNHLHNGSKKFVSTAQKTTTWLAVSLKDDVRGLSNIWKFFNCSIALSTCIHNVAMRLVSTNSSSFNCFLPFMNSGIFNRTPSKSKSSLISNPLSAMTESPSSSKSSIPERLVSSLSEIEPGYKSEMNVTAPDGEIPISPFICCGFCNFSILTVGALVKQVIPQKYSVASIITLVVGYRTLKTLDIFERMRGLGAHKGTCFNCKYTKFIHFISNLETDD